ncbi:MAG: taurine ABC transporter substrate-binding protein [Alphaproteobacteria bacterium]
MNRILWAAIACLGVLAPGTGGFAADDRPVTVGYQLVYNPWKVFITTGAFAGNTSRSIEWRQFDSGAQVINALALGKVDIAMAGSSPIAAGLSRGIDMELFWIVEDIAAAEALVVRAGSGIAAPQDLRGKTVAVPLASTTHFHLLFALEQFGIDPGELTIRGMQPPEITEAWAAGKIDAAFVWDPALGQIKKTGHVLITSGVLSSWGKATFDGMVASRAFTADNPGFMCKFVKTLVAADAAYRDDPETWTPDSEPVQAIVGLIGGNPEEVAGVLALYDFPTLEQQASTRWLGGGAARALNFTSEFLMAERKIPAVLPDYAPAVNPRWVRAVIDGGC